ncbi:hypothetical protein PFLUV_G00090290 [Perca fluviatilis]|uniref:Protein S100 n=1 Tax=Perca fluviatilis TaxID=8168 RepID=A0A6A5F8U7_PERFL|nr:protein S100-A1-like [Perca fluviatilis]KAF1388448.1 hypothetical protein PFLUV_G00090290 [Perca fluviatilis]
MSQLKTAMAILIEVFHSYSGKEGDKYKLNKSELKNLLETELEIDGGERREIKDMMRDLDADGDGEVDFQEYVTMVAAMTMVFNEFFQKY